MTTADRPSILFAWSSGKDSALALSELQQTGKYNITALLTTVTETFGRVSMHGVRQEFVELQAESMNLELTKVLIPDQASMDQYETRMGEALAQHKARGVEAVAFGDIFLEDLRKQREDKLAAADMKAIFPIWKRDTTELANSFIQQGFKAIVTCVDTEMLDGTFAGRYYDEQFLSDLPDGVDPCGENGEFHSFVFDGPPFHKPIAHKIGEVVLRENRFNFCDILPKETS